MYIHTQYLVQEGSGGTVKNSHYILNGVLRIHPEPIAL
jgi:hypothetical protein